MSEKIEPRPVEVCGFCKGHGTKYIGSGKPVISCSHCDGGGVLYSQTTIESLQSQLAEAVRERDANKLDAERYRYLRIHSTGPVEPWSTHKSPESLDETLDQVVDASIAAQEGMKG